MLGDNIRNIRKNKKISINKLSKITGISLGYLSDLENNKAKNPSIEKLESIAKALNVSVNDFFDKKTLDTVDRLFVGPGKLVESPKDYNYKVTSRDKKQYIEEMKKANEAFFMNDELNEESKKEMLDLMSQLFWEAKSMNKRKK